MHFLRWWFSDIFTHYSIGSANILSTRESTLCACVWMASDVFMHHNVQWCAYAMRFHGNIFITLSMLKKREQKKLCCWHPTNPITMFGFGPLNWFGINKNRFTRDQNFFSFFELCFFVVDFSNIKCVNKEAAGCCQHSTVNMRRIEYNTIFLHAQQIQTSYTTQSSYTEINNRKF